MLPHDFQTLTPLLLAAVLVIAVWRDVTRHRIDNWISVLGIGVALGLQLNSAGVAGLALTLGGVMAGLAIFLPFYVAGGMAAGDVKLMAAAGAFLGPVDAVMAGLASLIAGTVLALLVMAMHGGLREGLGHTGRQLLGFGMTRIWVRASPDSIAARRFPYAGAIAVGCLSISTLRLSGVLPGVVQ